VYLDDFKVEVLLVADGVSGSYGRSLLRLEPRALGVRLVACIWRTRLPGCSLALFGCLDLPLGLAALVQDSPPGLALEKRQNRPFFLGLARSVRRLVR
jgi:hypothetical protein